MKIVHFALSCFYIEGYKYQENILPTIHAQSGHEVLVVASCVSFEEKGNNSLIKPTKYVSKDGFNVIRVPYRPPFNKGALCRVRSYVGVYDILDSFAPDIIYFHGCSAWELNTVVRYIKRHREVVLFLDNHGDKYNSATTWFSRVIQHKMFYRPVLRRALPYTEKVLCPSIECMDFCREIYGVPEDKLEFYPLGGMVIDQEERDAIGGKLREEEKIDSDTVIFTHTGRMCSEKRTLEIIDAFSATTDPRFHLWIIGVLMDDLKEAALEKIKKDERITYLGWKKGEELYKYLCATDCYVQPGGQSATMQNAICCGCAVMLFPFKSHQPFLKGNGYFVSTEQDMVNAFEDISAHPEKIAEMRKKSYVVAHELLDYKKLAARVCITRK